MAWYKLYLWSKPWRKSPMYNCISWYKGVLYKEWYNNLTPEQREEWDRLVEEDKRKKKEESDRAWAAICGMYSWISRYVDVEYIRKHRLW